MKESDVGEILIGGPSLAAGYMNNPELTAKKFIEWNGKRVYRTGDLAQKTKTGMSFLGRIDRMVKNRGFLINLEQEVEPAMLQFTGVRAAAAFQWRGKLMGFVLPATVNIEELRAFMKGNFDHFVIPDEILALDRFPLTVHGKVDRPALNAQLEDRITQNDAELDGMVCTSPADALRWAFAKCLQVPYADLDGTSSFSQLGGNSLAVINLSRRLRQQGYTIPVVEVLREDIISRLEQKLTKINEQNEVSGSNGVLQTEPEAVPPTDMHKIMLSQSQRDPMANVLMLRGRFIGGKDVVPTPSELHAAWTANLGAHSVFKTRYDMQNWTLHDLGRVNLDWEEVSVKAEEFDNALLAVEEQVWTYHKSLQSIPVSNLETPYCHMTCVYAPGRKAIGFVWRLHHVFLDPFSIDILMHGLEQALAGVEAESGPRLQEYSRFMQRYKAEKLDTAAAFWEDMLSPLSEQTLFAPPPPQAPHKGDAWQTLRFTTKETLTSVEEAVRKFNISSATLIFAAWGLALNTYTRSNFVPIGLSRSGRMAPWSQASSLVAAMNCRVPFATAIPPESTVVEWLVKMHNTLHSVAELENLCQSLDPSLLRLNQFRTGVQAYLHMPAPTETWEIHDKVTGQAGQVGFVWRVQLADDEAVEAELEVNQTVADIEWAKVLGTVAVQMLEGLANAQRDTKVKEFIRS
ncbi:hypothetical protein ACQKWADRAFT_303677, partial [Trichoderma austrokoningii]